MQSASRNLPGGGETTEPGTMAGSVRKDGGLTPRLPILPARNVPPTHPSRPPMKVSRPEESNSDFHLLETTPRVQTATMLLRHDEASGPVAEAMRTAIK